MEPLSSTLFTNYVHKFQEPRDSRVYEVLGCLCSVGFLVPRIWLVLLPLRSANLNNEITSSQINPPHCVPNKPRTSLGPQPLVLFGLRLEMVEVHVLQKKNEKVHFAASSNPKSS